MSSHFLGDNIIAHNALEKLFLCHNTSLSCFRVCH
nr:MAG TPA: hypothetical protein [Caudoviricetes sp.]